MPSSAMTLTVIILEPATRAFPPLTTTFAFAFVATATTETLVVPVGSFVIVEEFKTLAPLTRNIASDASEESVGVGVPPEPPPLLFPPPEPAAAVAGNTAVITPALIAFVTVVAHATVKKLAVTPLRV